MASLQSFLRNGGTIKELQEMLNLKVKTHSKYDNLYLFRYNQIRTPFNSKISRESRGVILDKDSNWKIIAYPYDKFFNYGEQRAVSIDWQKCRVYEKLDGTLITLYYYNGWQVSTMGTADAECQVCSVSFISNEKKTFRQLFWQIFKELNYELPKDRSKCYMFELLSPLNKIIVQHRENRLVLHGVRCLKTLQEYHPDEYKTMVNWNVEVPKKYSFRTFDSMLNRVRNFNPKVDEGVVIVDDSFSRLKLKSTAYIELLQFGNTTDSDSIKQKLLKCIQNNEAMEVLSVFPKWNSEYLYINNLYKKLVNKIEKVYNANKDINNDKELSYVIKEYWFRGCIFDLKRDRIESIEEWLQKQNTKSLLKKIYKN